MLICVACLATGWVRVRAKSLAMLPDGGPPLEAGTSEAVSNCPWCNWSVPPDQECPLRVDTLPLLDGVPFRQGPLPPSPPPRLVVA